MKTQTNSLSSDLKQADIVTLIKDLFICRDDVYAIQKKAGENWIYTPVRSPLKDETIISHLEGKMTLGIYPGADSTRWVCLDIDSRVPEEILETISLPDRISVLLEAIYREVELSELEKTIQAKVKKKMADTQRNYYLGEKI